MNITKIINTATVEVKDGKPETRTSDIKLYSCDPLSYVKFDPKATIVAVNQPMCEFAVNIKVFVKIEPVEQ